MAAAAAVAVTELVGTLGLRKMGVAATMELKGIAIVVTAAVALVALGLG